MGNWLPYDELVDQVRNHHHSGFSGLMTGVSDEQHSFQVGFRDGQIVLLTYRIFKGNRALEKLSQINRAKITQHPNTEVTASQTELDDTSAILSRLTTITDKDATPVTIDVVPELSSAPVISTGTPTNSAASLPASQPALGSQRIKVIKTAAIHHFGPIGAMVCDEYLSTSNLKNVDLNILLRRIAAEVGADDIDTEAFLNSTS